MPKKSPSERKPRERSKRTKTHLHPYGLNDKQWAFVVAYVAHHNATKAARLAGYSDHTAAKIGSQNLHKAAIAAAIEQIEARRAQVFEITADKVLQELARIAFTPDEEAPDRKVADQIKALDLIGRYLQMWTPKPGGGLAAPAGAVEDVREKMLKMMADMARREAIDVKAEPVEEAAPPQLEGPTP